MADSAPDKVRENRLRRMADRQGLTFEKVRRLDPRAIDYGLIRLSDENRILRFESTNLDEIEQFLTKETS